MKRVILGIGIGLGVAYLVKKMQEEGCLDTCCNHVDELISKSKRNLRNVADVAKNEADYIKERIEDTFDKIK